MGSKYAKLYAHKAIKLQCWYACFYLKEWNLGRTRNNNNNRPYIQSAKLQPIRPNSKFNKTVTSIGKGFASSKYDRNIVNDIIKDNNKK